MAMGRRLVRVKGMALVLAAGMASDGATEMAKVRVTVTPSAAAVVRATPLALAGVMVGVMATAMVKAFARTKALATVKDKGHD
jgi:hypothetical protein